MLENPLIIQSTGENSNIMLTTSNIFFLISFQCANTSKGCSTKLSQLLLSCLRNITSIYYFNVDLLRQFNKIVNINSHFLKLSAFALYLQLIDYRIILIVSVPGRPFAMK